MCALILFMYLVYERSYKDLCSTVAVLHLLSNSLANVCELVHLFKVTGLQHAILLLNELRHWHFSRYFNHRCGSAILLNNKKEK